ncbi:MAG: hypothetical protein BZY81_06190 [SAR202 cluster bacterium Io17-Chloro-G4]|nr:MAG: hypothetical protein BZY81_06190 [SAR202 cluster bacterium Io17-Chloro-G4]
MPNILDEIVAAKRQELALQKELVSLAALQDQIAGQAMPLSLSDALSGGGVKLIAEVKKASPSRGLLRADFDPENLAEIYASNGAAAISVLTDLRFQGELAHLAQIKSSGAAAKAPVIRKDFIFDPYQVYEARAAGADAFLLIMSVLSPQLLQELLELGHQLGMQSLVEIHDEDELRTVVESGAQIIGINNRDLRTFTTDLEVTQRLAPQLPKGKVVVSESGIFNQEHLRQLGGGLVNAVLVGEALVTATDVAAKVRELTGASVPSGG